MSSWVPFSTVCYVTIPIRLASFHTLKLLHKNYYQVHLIDHHLKKRGFASSISSIKAQKSNEPYNNEPNSHPSVSQRAPVKRGEQVQVTIEGLVSGGDGVARIGKYVVMIPHAVPGQKVRVIISRVRSTYANARILQVIEHSSSEVEPVCKHFGMFGCGGCKFQHIAYAVQLEEKFAQIKHQYQHVSSTFNCKNENFIKPIIGCSNIYEYRNKMEFTFGNRRWIPFDKKKIETQYEASSSDVVEGEIYKETSDFVLGLKPAGHFDKVLPIEYCHIQDPIANDILRFIYQRTKEMRLSAYDVYSHEGFLRNLVIRTAENKHKEMMVNFVTSFDENPHLLKPLAEELAKEFPSICSVVQNLTCSKGGVARGEEQWILFGRDYIEQHLLGLNFRLTANSFFQTNPKQTAILYTLVKEAADLQSNDVVLDLFCGIGSIGLYLAKSCKYVYGVDIIKEGIDMAQVNAQNNQIANTEFIVANLEKSSFESDGQGNLRLFEKDGIQRPNVVVVDPPRGGLHLKLIRWLRWLKPERIIYVSCNPSTQVRDMEHLCSMQMYQLIQLQPIDMFPHTPHLESIASLKRIHKV
eukprot:jgi/Galph1/4391/GphlegSOOS_G3036.1